MVLSYLQFIAADGSSIRPNRLPANQSRPISRQAVTVFVDKPLPSHTLAALVTIPANPARRGSAQVACQEDLPYPSLGLRSEHSALSLERGTSVALSIRDAKSREYYGLCVLALESPSPLEDKALSLSVFTQEIYGPDVGQNSRVATSRNDLMAEVLRFCKTHGYKRIHCYAPKKQRQPTNTIRPQI